MFTYIQSLAFASLNSGSLHISLSLELNCPIWGSLLLSHLEKKGTLEFRATPVHMCTYSCP